MWITCSVTRSSPDPTNCIFHWATKKASRGAFGTVGERTDEIVGHFRKLGIDTTFRSVPGGHFKDIEKRIADGIAAICSDRIAQEREDD